VTHEYRPDPRNDTARVWIDGALVARAEAKVSVLDSGFMLGDGVWESFRVHGGCASFLDAHLDRLEEGLAALDIDLGMSREALVAAIAETLSANGFVDDVHVRLMVTRGVRSTPYQDPRIVVGNATVVILPEIKAKAEGSDVRALRVGTVAIRRGRPDVQDAGLNSHSKINCILACRQAIAAGVDEALMLDPDGFVATCNSTNFFIVRGGEVWTAPEDYLMPGITRASVIACCREAGIPCFERRFPLRRVYSADEAFVTGSFAGLMAVGEVDGRTIGEGVRGPMTARLQALYAERSAKHAIPMVGSGAS
jgi:branched-chain amino acid aminotransferase